MAYSIVTTSGSSTPALEASRRAKLYVDKYVYVTQVDLHTWAERCSCRVPHVFIYPTSFGDEHRTATIFWDDPLAPTFDSEDSFLECVGAFADAAEVSRKQVQAMGETCSLLVPVSRCPDDMKLGRSCRFGTWTCTGFRGHILNYSAYDPDSGPAEQESLLLNFDALLRADEMLQLLNRLGDDDQEIRVAEADAHGVVSCDGRQVAVRFRPSE